MVHCSEVYDEMIFHIYVCIYMYVYSMQSRLDQTTEIPRTFPLMAPANLPRHPFPSSPAPAALVPLPTSALPCQECCLRVRR